MEERKAELLEILNDRTGRSFRVLPERGPSKLLNAFSLEEIDMALYALSIDPWHKQRLKELSSEYLLRATTIDKWLQIGQKTLTRINRPNEEPLVTL